MSKHLLACSWIPQQQLYQASSAPLSPTNPLSCIVQVLQNISPSLSRPYDRDIEAFIGSYGVELQGVEDMLRCILSLCSALICFAFVCSIR
jgi:hypothetical protein